jgi:hypothetical protein
MILTREGGELHFSTGQDKIMSVPFDLIPQYVLGIERLLHHCQPRNRRDLNWNGHLFLS